MKKWFLVIFLIFILNCVNCSSNQKASPTPQPSPTAIVTPAPIASPTIISQKSTVEEAMEALEKDPTNPELHFQLAKAYADAGDFEHAMPEYKKAINLDSKFLEAYIGLGRAYRQKQLKTEALTVLNKATQLAQAKKDSQSLKEINNLIGLVYNDAGSNFFRAGNYQKAIAEFRMAAQYDPETRATYLSNVASLYNMMGEHKQALEEYKKILDKYPNHLATIFSIGYVNQQLKNYPEAEQYYSKAILIEEKYAPAYLNLGMCYLLENNLAKAEETYNLLKEKVTDSPEAYWGLGSIALAKKDFEKAKENYNKSLEILAKATNPRLTEEKFYMEEITKLNTLPKISIWIGGGASTFIFNGKEYSLETKAILKGGKLLIPLEIFKETGLGKLDRSKKEEAILEIDKGKIIIKKEAKEVLFNKKPIALSVPVELGKQDYLVEVDLLNNILNLSRKDLKGGGVFLYK